MQSLANISSTEFNAQLTRERLLPGMFVQAGLAIGPFLFFIMVIAFAISKRFAEVHPEALEFLTKLTIANLAIFLLLNTAGYIIYRIRFSPARLESAYANDLRDKQGNPMTATPAEKAISFIRTSMLIRTALTDGSAFLGIVVLMVAVLDGLLLNVPWLWVNALPLVMHLLMIMVTFPTKDRVQRMFETNIQNVN